MAISCKSHALRYGTLGEVLSTVCWNVYNYYILTLAGLGNASFSLNIKIISCVISSIIEIIIPRDKHVSGGTIVQCTICIFNIWGWISNELRAESAKDKYKFTIAIFMY